MPAVLGYVAANFGVSIVPDCSVPGWRRNVSFVQLKEKRVIDTFCLVRRDNHKLSLQPFINMAKDVGNKLYKSGYADMDFG